MICLGFTGLLAWNKVITAGEVVLYQNYFGQIVTAVSGVVNLFPALARGMESLNSINEIMAPATRSRAARRPPLCRCAARCGLNTWPTATPTPSAPC